MYQGFLLILPLFPFYVCMYLSIYLLPTYTSTAESIASVAATRYLICSIIASRDSRGGKEIFSS